MILRAFELELSRCPRLARAEADGHRSPPALYTEALEPRLRSGSRHTPSTPGMRGGVGLEGLRMRDDARAAGTGSAGGLGARR